jgi:hypothetical protein
LKLRWKKVLNSRCRDLLEVDDIDMQKSSSFLCSKVDFLHRTVRDFSRSNYHDELRRRAGDNFDARSSLCKAIVALSKVSADSAHLNSGFSLIPDFDLVDEMLLYAKDFERSETRSLAGLLDELDRVNSQKSNRRLHWTNWRIQGREGRYCTFLALAVQAGLQLYVKEKLDLNNTFATKKRGHPLLDYACRPEGNPRLIRHVQQEGALDLQMVRLLLERGSNPNGLMCDDFSSGTVWGFFIGDCYKIWSSKAGRPLEHTRNAWYEALELMVDHGARISDDEEKKSLRTIFGDHQTESLELRMAEAALRKTAQPSRDCSGEHEIKS